MIQARKLGHIVLNVRDAGRSRDFYTRTLGATNRPRGSEARRRVPELRPGAPPTSRCSRWPRGEAPDATQPGLHHMAWQLGSFEELQAAYRDLKAMGVAVESTIEHNVTRSVYFP